MKLLPSTARALAVLPILCSSLAAQTQATQSDAVKASPPEIIKGSNGESEVVFREIVCVVYYNETGSRKNAIPACSSEQVERADLAMKGYRAEQGMGHDVGHGDSAEAAKPPEIFVGSNGDGEVVFGENNCVVYYNGKGGRKNYLPACSQPQIDQADRAMRGYRAEQGMDH